MKGKFSTRSMRFRIVAVVTGIIALLVALLFGSNLYAISIVRGQVFDTYSTTLRVYMNSVENELSLVDAYLANVVLDTGDIADLQIISSRDNEEWSLAANRQQRRLSTALHSYSMVDGFFIYQPDTAIWIDATQSNYANTRRHAVRDTVTALVDSGEDYQAGWFAVHTGEEYVLARIQKKQGSYLGAWLSTAQLTQAFEQAEYSNLDYIFFCDAEGNPLDETLAAESLSLDLVGASSHYQLAGSNDRWLLVAQSNSRGNLYLAVLINDKTILEGLGSLRLLMPLLVLAVLLALLLLVFALRRTLMRPLAQLTGAMKALQKGDWNAHVTERHTYDEFVEVNTAFNHMVEEIEDLKINVYEQELEKQGIELQMLKAQLTPHTFVNCLNTMHGLAGTGETELVQRMAVDLSRHLRYTLAAGQVVPLARELEHARNYVELSAIRFRDSVRLEEAVEPQALDALVPPLLLQTFVENTIKYEVVPGEQTVIYIEVECRDESHLHVRIWDTGEGYGADALAKLAQPVAHSGDAEGKGIGLANLRQRLALLYGEANVEIDFSNREGAGAQTDILLPYTTQWEADA